VYEVGFDGAARPLVRDPKLSSVLGIAVDARSNRLLVTNSDLGAGVRRSARGPKQEAGVAAYDLATGEALFYADLSALLPSEDHLINGITVDANGNAYVTDSFSPTIYKVDRTGAASVFLRSEVFRGPAINLNGIVYHPRGFLLVVKKSTGELYRVPLDDPQRFSRIELPLRIPGGDGLLLVGDARLIVIANQTAEVRSNAAFVLATDDGWRSGRMVESTSLGQVYPTTCAALQNKVYVLSSQLDEWLSAEPSARASLTQQARQAEIRQLAEIIR
jgi:DNA-binding beta-propeller fold protein YncE